MARGHHHHQEGIASPTLLPCLLISDALHNIGDGAAVAAGFLISIHVGIAVGIAVIAHEVGFLVGIAIIVLVSFLEFRN
jgi:zinc transporter ZupT